MAIAYLGSSTVALTATSFSAPFTTLQNDMVVIVAGSTNANWSNGSSTLPNNGLVTWSGLGATWINFALNSTGNGYAVWIGTGCTAGLSTLTKSGTPPSTTGNYAVAQFSGVASIASYSPILTNATTNSTASTTVSYNMGQLLIGTAESYQWATTTGAWNGVADTLAIQSGTQRIPLIDYLIAPLAQSSVTYTTPKSASGQVFNAGQAFVINPVSTGNQNFLSFM
jgi:hypothetical protein